MSYPSFDTLLNFQVIHLAPAIRAMLSWHALYITTTPSQASGLFVAALNVNVSLSFYDSCAAARAPNSPPDSHTPAAAAETSAYPNQTSPSIIKLLSRLPDIPDFSRCSDNYLSLPAGYDRSIRIRFPPYRVPIFRPVLRHEATRQINRSAP